MVQWLSVLAALPKNLGSIPSTYMAVYNGRFLIPLPGNQTDAQIYI